MSKRALLAASLSIAVGLCSATAWAITSKTEPISSACHYSIRAVVVVDSDGGCVYAQPDQPEEKLTFDVGFGTDGKLRMNGTVVSCFYAGHTFEVDCDACEFLGIWTGSVTVTDQTTGRTLYSGTSLALGSEEPTSVTATAQEILGLSADS